MRYVIGWWLVMAGAALAQAVPPTDYSPFSEVSIRTLRIEGRAKQRWAVVAIRNDAARPIDVSFECVSYAENGEPISSRIGRADVIPPGQEVASESVSFDNDPKLIRCRVKAANEAR